MRVPNHVEYNPLCFVVLLGFVIGSIVLMPQFVVEASLGSRATAAPVVTGTFNGKLAFVSDRHNGRGLNIWTMNPDGGSVTRLTDGKSRTDRLPAFVPVYDDGPAWSPAGSKIAFISNRDYSFGLYTMNADGTNVQLVTDQALDPAGPAWSPDGKKIAFTAGHRIVIEPNRPVVDIYVINADGTGQTKLTDNSGENEGPTWSPDGKQIAFSSNRDPDGRSRIWVMNSDGTNHVRLTDIHDTSNPIFYGDSMPDWSPDGSRIVFNGYRDFNGTRNCFAINCSEIFVMNADGTSDHAITNDPNRGGIFEYPRWSPDGTRLVTSLALGTITDLRAGNDLGRAIIVMNADGTNQMNLSVRTDHAFFDVAPDWQPLATAPLSPSSVISFTAGTYTAFEDSGSVTLTVSRTGNLNDVASCAYATQDGSASFKYNYAPVWGTLRFAPGESSKSISVSLTDSGWAQGNVSFKVSLSENEGNATLIGGIREATVTVLDRDTSVRPQNPIDDTKHFVRQHYLDFLNREPDMDGFAFWINQIESCGSDAQCREVKRINVSAAFYLSIEFQETGSFAYRFNLLNLSGASDPPFLATVRAMQEIGRGVVVGQPGWEEQLKSNKLSFVQRYYDEDRLVLSFGRSNEEWIDLVFKYINMFTGITLPQAKRDALVAGLNSGAETRPTTFIKILDDPDYKAAQFNQLFVIMQYSGSLRRVQDQDGLTFWENKLNQFNGNFIDAEMVKAFITSREYRGRFGPP